jgi:hypothetical protein
MLNELIEIRNIALDNYYLTENKQQLGLYNKAVTNLKNYLDSQEYLDTYHNGSRFIGIIDPLKTDNISISKIKDENKIDISDVDMYTIDFELDVYGEK